MEVDPRVMQPQAAVLMPAWLTNGEVEPEGFQRGDVVAFNAGIGNRQIDVDHRLCRSAWDLGGADVRKLEHAGA
ncbi:hypothetical protein D3C72_2560950 [compost metagenome]